MKQLGLNEIREAFLSFFENKGHVRMRSASLVPRNDKSLLLIAAGMAPLKPYFTGQETPPGPRAASCQKCVRTNDIENVGVTSRHGTFFEMLGNFSFGDYFKEQAIPWAWEFLTEVMEIPALRLFPSVYAEDDEAFAIWRDTVGIAESRITRLGKADNFWELGVGPCGPCSEIYFDRGEDKGCGSPDCAPGCDCDRFIEIWNLVFIQFKKEEDGSYVPLDKKGIDTGMGLERISITMQGANSLFDVDTIRHIRDAVCKAAAAVYGAESGADKSIRIITDHARAMTFMASDGILPTNEGRGYVMRRLLRRAALHGRLLGVNKPFLADVSRVVAEVSGGAYPELVEKAEYIATIIDVEEKRFYETLDQGMDVLKKLMLQPKEPVSPAELGKRAFLLYDTYGFPPELTQEIMRGEGLKTEIDMDAFAAEMNLQRARARGARGETNYMGAEETALTRLPAHMETRFVGYDSNACQGAVILAVIKGDAGVGTSGADDACVSDACVSDACVSDARVGDEVVLVPDITPLYAESGGQKADSGVIRTETGTVTVTDCQRVGNKTAHYGVVESGYVKAGQKAEIVCDVLRRQETARNHSATHLLHRALRDVLGAHVEQAGSLVSRERLRFDFTHFQPLTDAQLREVELSVNNAVTAALPVAVTETSPGEARSMGALALFGEKYGDVVRVVAMGGDGESRPVSIELCGGTHVLNTAQIGLFKILSETGVAAGVRRIEALTGLNALAHYESMEERLREAAALLKTAPDKLIDKITALLSEHAAMQKEAAKYAEHRLAAYADELAKKAERIGDTDGSLYVVAADASGAAADADSQRLLADKLRDKMKKAVALLYFSGNGKASLMVTATGDAVKAGVHCGNIVKETAKAFGTNGGGRPNMAQAGIPVNASATDVIAKAKSLIIKG